MVLLLAIAAYPSDIRSIWVEGGMVFRLDKT